MTPSLKNGSKGNFRVVSVLQLDNYSQDRPHKVYILRTACIHFKRENQKKYFLEMCTECFKLHENGYTLWGLSCLGTASNVGECLVPCHF